MKKNTGQHKNPTRSNRGVNGLDELVEQFDMNEVAKHVKDTSSPESIMEGIYSFLTSGAVSQEDLVKFMEDKDEEPPFPESHVKKLMNDLRRVNGNPPKDTLFEFGYYCFVDEYMGTIFDF